MREKKIVESFWNEKWVEVDTPVPTKTCDYFISNYGKIKSVNKVNGDEVLLKGSTLRGGYRVLNMRLLGDKRLTVYVHKFVAKHFKKNKNVNREFVVHIDEDKNNNYWKNLKWVTRDELTKWQIEHGVYDPLNKKRASNTKMTETRVKILKKRLKEGKTKKKVLAKNFNISLVHLRRIEKGEYWGYVELDKSGIKNR